MVGLNVALVSAGSLSFFVEFKNFVRSGSDMRGWTSYFPCVSWIINLFCRVYEFLKFGIRYACSYFMLPVCQLDN